MAPQQLREQTIASYSMLDDGALVRTLQGHTNAVYGCAFSPVEGSGVTALLGETEDVQMASAFTF